MMPPPSHAPAAAGHLLASSMAARSVHGPPVGVMAEQMLLFAMSGASNVLSTVISHGAGFCAEVFVTGKASNRIMVKAIINRKTLLIIPILPDHAFHMVILWYLYDYR